MWKTNLPATELTVLAPVRLFLARQRNDLDASARPTLRMCSSPSGNTE